MYGYIYITTNLINGKIYIGQKKGDYNKYYYGSGKNIKRALKNMVRRISVTTLFNIAVLEKNYVKWKSIG